MFLKPMFSLITSHLILHTLIQYLCFVTSNLKKHGWSAFKSKFSSWKCRPPQFASHLQSQRQPGCLRRSVHPPTALYSWPCSRSESSSVSLFPGLSPSLCSNPELYVLGEWCVAAEHMNNVYNFTQKQQMFPSFLRVTNQKRFIWWILPPGRGTGWPARWKEARGQIWWSLFEMKAWSLCPGPWRGWLGDLLASPHHSEGRWATQVE